MQDVTVAERWTQERRREHTRQLLLDAADEVFANKGFEGASLEEIAETAGYTRGAIYKQFGGKEELFLEANRRFNERYINRFVENIDPDTPLEELDLASIAKTWRAMQGDNVRQFALGLEFQLYVLRNPEAQARVAAERRKTVEMIAALIDAQAELRGSKTRLSSLTIARLAMAASDGIRLEDFLDPGDDDLYEAFLQVLISTWEEEPKPSKPKPRATKK